MKAIITQVLSLLARPTFAGRSGLQQGRGWRSCQASLRPYDFATLRLTLIINWPESNVRRNVHTVLSAVISFQFPWPFSLGGKRWEKEKFELSHWWLDSRIQYEQGPNKPHQHSQDTSEQVPNFPGKSECYAICLSPTCTHVPSN